MNRPDPPNPPGYEICAPTWCGILPLLLYQIETGQPEQRRAAVREIERMARAADKAVAAEAEAAKRRPS